jgi:transcriptional regulator with XRE-family HTH domain
MPAVNLGAVGEYIRQQREQAMMSLRQLAQATDLPVPYLSQLERGLRRPGAEILLQIARGLRLSAEALDVQAGFLADQPPDTGVRPAVRADPALSQRQKQVLLEIYDSFRTEAPGPSQPTNGRPAPEPAGPATGAGPSAGAPPPGPSAVPRDPDERIR